MICEQHASQVDRPNSYIFNIPTAFNIKGHLISLKTTLRPISTPQGLVGETLGTMLAKVVGNFDRLAP